MLQQYLAEGPENVVERHRRAARAVRAGVQALVVPCIIALVAGGAVGGVFMAYHSAQGPR